MKPYTKRVTHKRQAPKNNALCDTDGIRACISYCLLKKKPVTFRVPLVDAKTTDNILADVRVTIEREERKKWVWYRITARVDEKGRDSFEDEDVKFFLDELEDFNN